MSNIINPPLLQKRVCEDPRCVRDDFVHPATMTDALASFGEFHHGVGFVGFYYFVAADTDEEMNGGEG